MDTIHEKPSTDYLADILAKILTKNNWDELVCIQESLQEHDIDVSMETLESWLDAGELSPPKPAFKSKLTETLATLSGLSVSQVYHALERTEMDYERAQKENQIIESERQAQTASTARTQLIEYVAEVKNKDAEFSTKTYVEHLNPLIKDTENHDWINATLKLMFDDMPSSELKALHMYFVGANALSGEISMETCITTLDTIKTSKETNTDSGMAA